MRKGSSRIPVWIRDILRHFRLQKLEATCEFGFRDPAVTGMMYGWICAFRASSSILDNVHVRPNFNMNRFQGDCLVVFRFVLIAVLVQLIRKGMEMFRVYRLCRV